ncbi:hypothetical protein, conserved [Babesia bigemina]|uniref:Uncharacterized protein n=1 Tax=Babesia bigemina TaxID=5866 RepID=A0A061D789_BABBI|nr:hypothetical protein, conserved [Babesia bigemina]CDR96403.1 hypothetical protein, conserved [Babesia bigemina]|eukprot:XP_012768589.1 hypothetical protein, conserved [Babesia bigemina]
MRSILLLAHLVGAFIAIHGGSAALRRTSPSMMPYVEPQTANDASTQGGVVIMDTEEGVSRLPFVEVYGGRAYHYKDSKGKHYRQNDFRRRQESLQKTLENLPDAYETIRYI